MNIRHLAAGISVLLAGLTTGVSGALAAQAAEDETLFNTFCMACHTPQPAAAGSPNERAPTLSVLKGFTPESVVNALTNGKMQPQGLALSEAQRRMVAEYATGKRLAATPAGGAPPVVNRCSANPSLRAVAQAPAWNGYGNGPTGTRFQDAKQGGLRAEDLPRLKLKWAFGYASVSAARAQPTVAAGRLFVASENGEVHALDPRTGCSYWTFRAQAGVRTAPVVGKAGGVTAVFFGDGRANVYALDAHTGALLWTRKVHEHASASITGGLNVADGRVFVPVQGLNEEGRGSRDNYPCCSFRGALVALDARDGRPLWTGWTIDAAQPRGVNKAGVQMMGPAGGAIWSQPTLDARRGLVYVATGNAYADPPQKMTNAVIAFEQKSGKVAWVHQLLVADQWAMGCEAKNNGNPACPETLGPDFDFSASPELTRVGGRDLLVLPQKSAIAYALDPDKQGALVWQHRFGKGSGLGGQWGGASDGQQFYTGLADFLTDTPGGVHAVRLRDGQPAWSAPPAQPLLCGEKRPGCSPGQGGAVTAIPGAVLAGSLDGGLRAYASRDGAVLWVFDTNQEFVTVNGVKANGGSMDGPGPVVAGGMLYVNSGYGGLVGRPGNVLLAFGLE
jgi:polyvinyl alcohol dehydrogenase (cytochrome)